MKVSASDASAIQQVLEIESPLISPGDLGNVPRGWFVLLGTLPLEQRRAEFISLLQRNYDGQSAAILATIDKAKPVLEVPSAVPPGHLFDDIGNGERLVIQYGNRIRYVMEWGWLHWTGKVWEADRYHLAAMAKATARSIYMEAAACTDDKEGAFIAKWAKNSASKFRRSAMIEAASSEPGIPVTTDDFDQHPHLINLSNGIYDLKADKLLPHDPDYLMTKISPAHFNPAATCPIWLSFLERIFNSNQDMIAFIQRAVGYTLAGDTGEQCLFFLYGTGANGKSVFCNTLDNLMGDYSSKTPIDTLMTRTNDTIPNDLARLAGARVVMAAEIAYGRQLNESIVKDLTGGDTITARFLHKEYFEFHPHFKIWMYGNHKPGIRGADEGIWRRIRLVPFNVTIPVNERIPLDEFVDTLKAELDGIFQWALDGYRDWAANGLQPPAQVDRATLDYRNEQDTIGAFLTECCREEPDLSITAGLLFKIYSAWLAKSGEDKETQRSFSQKMALHGYSTKGEDGKPIRNSKGQALYLGLGRLYD